MNEPSWYVDLYLDESSHTRTRMEAEEEEGVTMLQRQFMFWATWDFEACFLAQNTDHTHRMTLYFSYDTSMLTLTCSFKRVCYAFDMSI